MSNNCWKTKCLPVLVAVIAAWTASAALAQRGGAPSGGGGFGGGRGPGGGRGNMGDSIFDGLVKSYGGSGDTLDYSKIPDDKRKQIDSMAKFTNAPLMPTSGTISREAYKAELEQRMQAMRSGGGFGGPQAPAPMASPSGSPAVVMIGPGGAEMKTEMTMGRGPGGNGGNGFGGPQAGGGFGGPGAGGGGWGGQQTDPDTRFKEYDTDGDGKLTKDELSKNPRGARMLGAFEQADTNRDGAITIDEYRTYYAQITGGFGGGRGGRDGGGGNGGWGGPGGGAGWGGNMQDQAKMAPPMEAEDEKPVIYRYGSLPKGMPEWFNAADNNRDAQVGLYEWNKFFNSNGDRMKEFTDYDLNGDGLITCEEYLRSRKIKGLPPLVPAMAPGMAGGPQPGAFPSPGQQPGAFPSPGQQPGGMPQQPRPDANSKDRPADTKRDDKKDERKDNRNDGSTGRSSNSESSGADRPSRNRNNGGSNGGGGNNPFNSGK